MATKAATTKTAAAKVETVSTRQLASQLAHPRCVFVLAADTDAGRPYIVMELMPGRTLKDLVDQTGPLPADIALPHILDVIDGLAEAHRLGVLHRDVKPSNCFLTADNRVKIGDFAFFNLLRTWVAQHRYGNATTPQFIALAKQISGMDLDRFFDVWLYQPEKPTSW